MLDFIKGEIVELNPAYVVLEANSLGYFVNISLSTYTVLSEQKMCKLYVYEAIREDAYILYGFLSPADRQIFLHLISVSGVGANTARMIMSSLSTAEIQEVIATQNENALKSVKGIGLKTAQRIIVDLKDKILRTEVSGVLPLIPVSSTKSEALSALVMLGFNQQASQKALDKILAESPQLSVEELIKKALKMI